MKSNLWLLVSTIIYIYVSGNERIVFLIFEIFLSYLEFNLKLNNKYWMIYKPDKRETNTAFYLKINKRRFWKFKPIIWFAIEMAREFWGIVLTKGKHKFMYAEWKSPFNLCFTQFFLLTCPILIAHGNSRANFPHLNEKKKRKLRSWKSNHFLSHR